MRWLAFQTAYLPRVVDRGTGLKLGLVQTRLQICDKSDKAWWIWELPRATVICSPEPCWHAYAGWYCSSHCSIGADSVSELK